MSSEPLISEENVLRILVATDIHLGYNEKKEALCKAVDNKLI